MSHILWLHHGYRTIYFKIYVATDFKNKSTEALVLNFLV